MSKRARTRSQAVIREAREELGIAAEFHPAFGGDAPFFLTVTPTDGANSHLDVDLWFVLRAERDAPLFPSSSRGESTPRLSQNRA